MRQLAGTSLGEIDAVIGRQAANLTLEVRALLQIAAAFVDKAVPDIDIGDAGLASAVAMEGVAWASHRYIMHGFGWAWHRDHHEPHDGLLEKNDRFALFGAALSIAMFAWGSFRRKPANLAAAQIGPVPTGIAQFFIAIYGGYFGGGIGFLMMAALSMAGVTARHAAATKNVLASVMNAAAVALFVTSPLVHWPQAIALGAGAILGGLAGVWALRRVNERWLRIAIVCIGLALTVGLFVKPV